VAAIAALAAFACSEKQEPTGTAELRLSETYVLRTIDGDAVPALFTDNDFATQRIVADTLILASRGMGREVQVVEVLDKTTGEETSYTATYDLTFTVDDGRIEIAYECNDVIIFASCIAPPHLVGVVGSTGLLFDRALGRTPLAFERI
jgi:hypothetical protein